MGSCFLLGFPDWIQISLGSLMPAFSPAAVLYGCFSFQLRILIQTLLLPPLLAVTYFLISAPLTSSPSPPSSVCVHRFCFISFSDKAPCVSPAGPRLIMQRWLSFSDPHDSSPQVLGLQACVCHHHLFKARDPGIEPGTHSTH